MTATLQHGHRMAHLAERVRRTRVLQHRGRVAQVIGLIIEAEGPLAAVGEVCRIESAHREGATFAEIVGFRDRHVLLMPLGEIHGIQPGSEVIALGRPLQAPVGERLKGRVIDGLGNPIDGRGSLEAEAHISVNVQPPHPLRRQRITQPFQTGVKALDTFIPCGRGQRLGIFAGSGVGKSTLLGMMASRAEADVNVIALLGERGREVRAFVAMTIAEHFRDVGQNVLLMMDSVTRFAMAQREIGLAVGEPPATRGYTPSVFSLLPQLLERAGTGEQGSITGLFTTLVEGDDMNEPIADAVRSILDGHIVLTRELATQNHYPAIDVLESVSRLVRDLSTPEQLDLAGRAREAMAVYRKNQDLISIGAYPPGSNAAIDRAIRLHEPLNQFLRQPVNQGMPSKESWKLLAGVLAQGEPDKPTPAPKK
jgi:flagellum-specific ATP synthase